MQKNRLEGNKTVVRNRRKNSTKAYFCMLMPGFLWLFFFNIVPMTGIYMAFTNFNPGVGIFKSPFVGLDNFKYMFQLKDVRQVFLNTLFIAVSKLLLNLVIPLVFALLINEVSHGKLKKLVQTVCYMPHFLSWVILAGILANVFAYNGPVNTILNMLGKDSVLFFGSEKIFPQIIIWSDVWKEFGYNAVIFLAAVTGIDQGLYEAAEVDGAGRWQQTLHITLPGIRTTIVLVAVLALGNILNAGFDQIFNLYNPAVYSTGDILDTWVYRAGLKNFQYSLGTAVGLLKSVISFLMITISYWLAKHFANYTIF